MSTGGVPLASWDMYCVGGYTVCVCNVCSSIKLNVATVSQEKWAYSYFVVNWEK